MTSWRFLRQQAEWRKDLHDCGFQGAQPLGGVWGRAPQELCTLKHDLCLIMIGIFDSGVGGLTVLDAIRAQLPHEDLVYLGDTARVPYGNPACRPSTRSTHERPGSDGSCGVS